ncbi:AfsR/SARP family transcriptional regulator [Actinophytocola gossypii]|uniref:Tetratricopeptide repeat protein n=1 Tax=Actinophytocola gossypii TaxID=2812003 RepID=A0ABT2JGD5_9PSEU|nr:BTAD domain-containing putative transcriptional regulator [Actinophytocola gossypii]MCT2586932.1 tetratricopeptide repeat protein [Actinophytocola gossypii]
MTVHGARATVGPTKIRSLLGILAYRCNEPVALSVLAEALWDDDGPTDRIATLQSYKSRLCRTLELHGLAEVSREHGGYRLRIDPSAVDFHRFEATVRDGHRAAGRGDHAAAADLFDAAVRLWRGPLIADLSTTWARRQQESLRIRNLLPAQCALLEAKLRLADHDFVLGALSSLLDDYPLEDQPAMLLMRALAAANRAQEVRPFFRDYCQRLQDEHGTVPGADLMATYQEVTGRGETRTHPAPAPRPPRATPHFIGREHLIGQLDALLTGPEPPTTLVALDGQPGVGKTTLVKHWAHSRQHLFPDGVLHADLGGYSTTGPVEPGTAIAGFLDMLDVPAADVPPTTEDRAALLRQRLVGRRVLVVIDNVRNSSHVRPVLAAVANCPTVITSRQRLTGNAVRDGAERFTVPELSTNEAAGLLAAHVGPRTADEPAAVAEFVALCDRLPMAVCIAGQYAASRPAVPIGDLADELRQTRRLLDIGSHGDDTTLRSTYALSYRALPAAQARLFRLIGLLPARFSVAAAGAVSAVRRPDVDDLLDGLVSAHLVEQEGAGRFRIHDLLHQFAADSADEDEPAADREASMLRLLTWYVCSARNARPFLTSDPHDVPELTGVEPVTAREFVDRDDARAWFTLERKTMVSLVQRAGEQGHHEHVWRLAACLNLVNTQGDLHEMLGVHQRGAESAAIVGQRVAEAGCLNNVGYIHQKLQDAVRAGRYFKQAYHAFHAVGETYGEAVSLHNIGTTHLELGDPADAIAWYRRALHLFSAADQEWAIANVYSRLGEAFRRLDQFDEADSHYQRAWRIHEKLGDQRRQGEVLNRLARLYLDRDQPRDAVAFGQHALDLHDRTGDRDSAAEVLCTLAEARLRLGERAEATAHASEAARTYAEMGNVSGQATALSVLTEAQAAAGEEDQARTTWAQVTELLDGIDDERASNARERLRWHSPSVPAPRSTEPAMTRSRVTRSNHLMKPE